MVEHCIEKISLKKEYGNPTEIVTLTTKFIMILNKGRLQTARMKEMTNTRVSQQALPNNPSSQITA